MSDKLSDILTLAELLSGLNAPPEAPENVAQHPMSPVAGIRLDGTLRSVSAAVDTATPPRLAFVLGPDSSLRGAAARLAALLDPAAAPRVDDLARALLSYNADVLGLAGEHRPVRVGLVARCPVELQSDSWVSDRAALDGLAERCDAAWLPVLDEPAAPLALPSPDDVTAVSTAYAATFAQAGSPLDLARLGADLAQRLLTNPFDDCFLAMQVLRLPSVLNDGSQGAAAATALAGSMAAIPTSSTGAPAVPDQTDRLDLLARFTAGSGILRRLLALALPGAAVDPTTAAAVATLRTALGLPRDGDPQLSQCGVACAELPLPAAAMADRGGKEGRSRRGAEAAGGIHRLAFGRDLCAGFTGRYPTTGPPKFVGPSLVGWMDVTAFVQSVLAKGGLDAQLTERLRIVAAIAHNEGQLDGARLRDAGVLSLGIQQWTSANANELPALLARFKSMAPDEYDFFFGIHNLQVDAGTGRGNSTLRAVQPPGTAPLSLRAYAENAKFFGGTADGDAMRFCAEWGAIVRAASLFGPTLRLTQILQAADRFDRIRTALQPIKVGHDAATYPIEKIMTSEKAAALVLDAHINAPGHLQRDLQRAVDAVQPPIVGLDDAARTAITDSYLSVRRLADKKRRNRWIVSVSTPQKGKPAQLSSLPGSFNVWGAAS